MPDMLGTLLWAVHISDGILAWPWWSGGLALAALLALFGAWRIRDDEIPQIALLSTAFFVASSIHVRVFPTSVHLLLNGLVGVILGRRAALAIPVGLFLQAALLGHGGFLTLGVNSCVMVLPALMAWQLFALLGCLPLLRQRWFTIGLLIGSTATLATVLLNSLVLAWGGQESWRTLAQLVLLAHLPIVAIEGIVVGFTVRFLAQVKPEMLGLVLHENRECPIESVP
ncbi:MAG TPA: CbiM family transporter [Gemmataceae bacterium]|nr:CbiM family transporter [Gemmataceae bacterium]